LLFAHAVFICSVVESAVRDQGTARVLCSMSTSGRHNQKTAPELQLQLEMQLEMQLE
jgi:hypothetical protein